MIRKHPQSQLDATCWATYWNVIVVLGQSEYLALNHIYPTLWRLYRDDKLPQTFFIGFESLMNEPVDIKIILTREDMIERMKVLTDERSKFDDFVKFNSSVFGRYDAKSFKQLNNCIVFMANEFSGQDHCNRIFYFAVPIFKYKDIYRFLKNNCLANSPCFNRYVTEKPFLEYKANIVSTDPFNQPVQRFRVDPFLGKSLLEKLVDVRLRNREDYARILNRDAIERVTITFMESSTNWNDQENCLQIIGSFLSRLLQMMCMLAMDSDQKIREKKMNLFKDMLQINPRHVVLGRYSDNENLYRPAFACILMEVDNKRWKEVPFVLTSGKGSGIQPKTEIRIHFKNRKTPKRTESERSKYELVIIFEPNEEIYIENTNNEGFKIKQNLELKCNKDIYISEAYDRLILDAFGGTEDKFVSADELKETDRIYCHLMNDINEKKIQLFSNDNGSFEREANQLIENALERADQASRSEEEALRANQASKTTETASVCTICERTIGHFTAASEVTVCARCSIIEKEEILKCICS